MGYKDAGVGQVPDHWTVTELRDFLNRITYGFTNPMPDAEEGPWKLTAKDVVNGYINYETARRTSQEAFDNLLTDKSRPNVGDVLLTKDGSIGRVAVVDREGICINQSVALLQPNEKIRPYFLKYLLIAPYYQRVMENDSDGSTIKHIYITRVDKMEVAVPPVEEQDAILQIIKTLDDKIELNRQTNQTLEQIAQTIFKSWFVDFEPVKAKIEAKAAGRDPERAAMCAISGKLETELDQFPPEQYQQLAATAALFPDDLVESELGVVPRGWELKPLYSTAEFINGAAFKSKDFSIKKDGLPIVKIAELKSGISDQTKFTTSDFHEKYRIDNDEVLYSWSGSPNTSLEVFKWFGGEGWLNQHIFKVVTDSIDSKYFVFFLLRHLKPALISIATDKQTTGLGHVTVADMKRLYVPYPNAETMSRFASIVGPLYEEASSLEKQSILLVETRDSLLPKLLSDGLPLRAIEEGRNE